VSHHLAWRWAPEGAKNTGGLSKRKGSGVEGGTCRYIGGETATPNLSEPGHTAESILKSLRGRREKEAILQGWRQLAAWAVWRLGKKEQSVEGAETETTTASGETETSENRSDTILTIKKGEKTLWHAAQVRSSKMWDYLL